MSGQDGYVAADALAALAILGLAVSGLAAGLFTLGRGELATTNTVARAVSLRSAAGEFARLLRDEGPFRSDASAAEGLLGTSGRLEFPCDAGRCAARAEDGRLVLVDALGVARAIRLPGVGPVRFAYVGSQGSSDHWPPPAAPPPAPSWQPLQAIVVEDEATGRALFVGRVAVQQAFDCEFDTLTQDCRRTGS